MKAVFEVIGTFLFILVVLVVVTVIVLFNIITSRPPA